MHLAKVITLRSVFADVDQNSEKSVELEQASPSISFEDALNLTSNLITNDKT